MKEKHKCISSTLNIYIFLLSIIVFVFAACGKKNEDLHIVFTGDVILDRGVDDELKLHGNSLLINSFSFIKDYDYLCVNLEGTLTDSGKVQPDKYNFKSSVERAVLLKKAGLTHACLANNHIFDYGQIGFNNTIKALINNNITPIGVSDKPTIISKNNYKCAILSASLTTHNELLPISSENQLKQSIKNFIAKSPNIPLVLYIHWGYELQQTPAKWQKKLAEELINLGVDAIIGHHPHVTQTIEFIKNKPVFYSLGNFIADAYLPNTYFSYTLELVVKDEIEKINITPINLKKYFPEQLNFKEQLEQIKKHLKYSNIVACYNDDNNAWQIIPKKNLDFSRPKKYWIIAEKNTISIIKKLKPNSFLLFLEKDGIKTNFINLKGKLSEYYISDINNDNQIDILVGITKVLKFQPVEKKRIQIYTFNKKYLIALWLGTKFIGDVKTFEIIRHNNLNYLNTTELDTNGNKTNRIYEWSNFGFALKNNFE